MECEACFLHPSANLREGRCGFFGGATEDDKVVGVSHHLVAVGCHLVIQRVEIQVR